MSLAWFLMDSTATSTAFSMPRLRLIGLALADQRLRQHGGGGGPVTGDVVGLLGYFLDQLGADLLVGLLELDLLGDRDAIVGDGGSAPLLLEHDVAALGAQRHLHSIGKLVHAPFERPAGVLVEGDDLRHARLPPSRWACLIRVTPGSGPRPRSMLALMPVEC